MRNRSRDFLNKSLEPNTFLSDADMDLVVSSHIQNDWTDNEPFDFEASSKLGFFCAQLAHDRNCGIGAVFLDAGIPTTVILAAASFCEALRHLSSVEGPHLPFACVATTEETLFDFHDGEDGREFVYEVSDSRISSNVYTRPKPDK